MLCKYSFPTQFFLVGNVNFFPQSAKPLYFFKTGGKNNQAQWHFFLENVIMKHVVCRGKNIQLALAHRYGRVQTRHMSLFLSLCGPQAGILELQPWDMGCVLLYGDTSQTMPEMVDYKWLWKGDPSVRNCISGIARSLSVLLFWCIQNNSERTAVF